MLAWVSVQKHLRSWSASQWQFKVIWVYAASDQSKYINLGYLFKQNYIHNFLLGAYPTLVMQCKQNHYIYIYAFVM